MSATSIETSRSPALGASKRLLVSGLFIVVSVALANLLERLAHLRSVRIDAYQWLIHPGDGLDDSWKPMLAAINWLKERSDGYLYQNVFFIQNRKFQYPLSSLLPLEFMDRKLGIEPTVDLLNDIGWFGILITLVAMIAYCLALAERSGAVRRDDRLGRVLVAGVAAFATLTFFPIMYAYTIGQAQVWINAAFVLICLCWISGRRMAAGMLIGAICLLKPQFAMFVIWGALRRQWSFLAGGCIVVAPVAALTLVHYGLGDNLDYLRVLRFLSAHGEIYYHNQSVDGLLNRLIVGGDSIDGPFWFPDFNPIVYGGMVASSALLVLAAWFLRARSPDRGGFFDLLTAAFTFTIASPIAWEYHYGIQLPILAALFFALVAQPRAGGRGVWATLAIAYVLAANFFEIANLTADTPFNFVQSYMLYGGLATLWLLYRIRTPGSFDRLLDRQQRTGSGMATAARA